MCTNADLLGDEGTAWGLPQPFQLDPDLCYSD